MSRESLNLEATRKCCAEKDRRFTPAELERISCGIDRRPVYRAVKRSFDVAFSACVLVVLLPVLALIALAVWLDDPHGSPLFFQERVGRRGRTFRMVKFRSMYVDAEDRLESLMSANEKDGPVFKFREDPRITRVGRFIRKTSLDELPQFWNVLLGDIPLRILKMHKELSAKDKGAFAPPAKSSTNESKAYLRVNAVVAANLRTRRVTNPHSHLTHNAEHAIYAKPIFGAVEA